MTVQRIPISDPLWAEFGLLARSEGKTRNGLLVDMIRERVVRERVREGRSMPADKVVANTIRRLSDTTTHSAKEE